MRFWNLILKLQVMQMRFWNLKPKLQVKVTKSIPVWAGMGLVAAAGVFEAHRISAEDFANSAPSIIKNQNLVIKFKEMYLTWEKAAPLVLGAAAFGSILPVESKDAFPVEQDDALKSREDDQQSPSSGRRWRLWPNPFRRVKTLEHSYSDASNEDVFLDSESGTLLEPTPSLSNQGSPHKQFVRTNVPTNEQIASLNLKDGQNTVTFSFSTRVLGTQQVDAHIYLWKWNARIVISDVDGTIT
ncbi:phosphatidate phosphatase LPIN3-like, partial [Trifolium medium]|nr:phosphatidate phosphatase LPIN3-like [Trifolium medium]